MDSFSLLSVLVFVCIIADGFAFTPAACDHRPTASGSELRKKHLTVVQSPIAYHDDWHRSLHPLNDFGVIDDCDSIDAMHAVPSMPQPRSASDGVGQVAEIATAFLPVATVVLLEICTSNGV